MKVSIVIPSWFEESQNGKYGENETFCVAAECLKRLMEVTPKDLYELIIIDNGSTLKDETILNIKVDYPEDNTMTPSEYFSKADILIRNEKNLGFAPAVNQGINAATGEYVMQLNNDIFVWEGFLEQMLEDYNKCESLIPPVGLLMPAITKEKLYFWEAIKMDKSEIDMQTNAGEFGRAAEFGSCYLGKKETYIKAAQYRDGYQVLDENFKVGFGEDRWLYREIRMLGMETYRTHNLRVLHVGNMSMSKMKQKNGVREAIDKNREYLQELKDKNNVK